LILSGNNSGMLGGFTIGPNNATINGGAANTTAAVRPTSSTALGQGTISFNGQGNATSPRLELTGGITITNPISFTGRHTAAQGIESFSGANVLSGTITGGAGGIQYPIQVDGS